MNAQCKKHLEARLGLCPAKDATIGVCTQPTAPQEVQALLKFGGETKPVKEQLNIPRKQEWRFIKEALKSVLVLRPTSLNVFSVQKINCYNTVKVFVMFSRSLLLHQNAFFWPIYLPSKTTNLYPHGLKEQAGF